jgi:hypothetical protein
MCRWHPAEEPGGCGTSDVAGELRIRIDPRFGTVTLPPRQRPPDAVEIRRPVGPAFDLHGVAGPQPRPSPLGELLCRGHQRLADALQRVVGAAPMAEGDLLSLSACLVGHRVGQPDGVEVPHHGRMAERRHQRAGAPAPRVQRGRADLSQPAARPGLSQPSTAALVRSATKPSSRPRSRSTRPVIYRVGAVGVARGKLVSPKPKAATPPDEQRRPPAGCRGPHRPHHGRPANAEVTSDRGHRVGVLADPRQV